MAGGAVAGDHGRSSAGHQVIDLAVDALAAYRLTRLITTDTFPPIKAVRDRVVSAHEIEGDPDAWAELVQCPWCSGMYVAFAVVLLRLRMPGLWGWVAKALATSAVVGMVSRLDD